jgi:hypothetical protein
MVKALSSVTGPDGIRKSVLLSYSQNLEPKVTKMTVKLHEQVRCDGLSRFGGSPIGYEGITKSPQIGTGFSLESSLGFLEILFFKAMTHEHPQRDTLVAPGVCIHSLNEGLIKPCVGKTMDGIANTAHILYLEE